jgi:PPOX class probable F420-dependent enzyme
MSQQLPADLVDLLRRPSPCFVATLMPDGSPQLTQTWVTTDGEHVVLNIVEGMQKGRNLTRDPRVAVNIVDPDNTRRYYAVRGRAITVSTDGAAESIDEISQKYLGAPYPSSAGQRETRVLVTIEAEKITPPFGS